MTAAARAVAPASSADTVESALADTVESALTLSPLARLLHGAVRLYQQLRFGRLSPCRFHPSCSAYAIEALEVHGARRGAWLTVRRLARCHPWGGHGFDLVPPARPSRRVGVDPSPGVAPADRKVP